MTPVSYQPFDGRDGLQVAEDRVHVYQDGQVVAEAETDMSLEELLNSYRILSLCPDLSFVRGEVREFKVDITLDFSLIGELFGTIVINGERALWRAECVSFGDFSGNGKIPDSERGWISAGETTGWQFYLPPAFIIDPDPAVVRRLALSLEAFVYALGSEREISVPYSRSFDNIISAQKPMWAINLPRIAAPKHMRAPAVSA
jgi:hypothetical protein